MTRQIKKENIKPLKPLLKSIHDGTIDKRTKPSKQLDLMKRKLEQDPKGTAISILKDTIARDQVIEQRIFTAIIVGDEPLMNEKKKLNPLVEKLLLKYQSAGQKALGTYLKLMGQDPDSGNEESDLLDELFRDENS
jgi:hypothetical protein